MNSSDTKAEALKKAKCEYDKAVERAYDLATVCHEYAHKALEEEIAPYKKAFMIAGGQAYIDYEAAVKKAIDTYANGLDYKIILFTCYAEDIDIDVKENEDSKNFKIAIMPTKTAFLKVAQKEWDAYKEAMNMASKKWNQEVSNIEENKEKEIRAARIIYKLAVSMVS